MVINYIKLTRGKYALVDDADFKWLSQWKWHCSVQGYAIRGIRVDGKVKKIWMHREILRPPQNKLADHINGDKLDNRRKNLRVATFAENQRNRPAYRSNTSGYKGVTFQRNTGKWSAQISRFGIHYHLGSYELLIWFAFMPGLNNVFAVFFPISVSVVLGGADICHSLIAL